MLKQTLIDRTIGVTPHRLFAAHILVHLSIIPMLAYGHWWQWLIAVLVYFLNVCLGMTMTYHRLLSHQSWKAPRWFEMVVTLCAVYGLTGSSINWVTVHREHQHHTEREAD